jgi:hypothetical protein
MSDSIATIKLVSADAEEYNVLVKSLGMSQTILDLMAEAPNAECIPIPNINGKTLERVVRFCNQYADAPPVVQSPLDENKRVELRDKPIEIAEWDREFLGVMPQDDVFELIVAANYLDVRSLLDVCARFVANSVVGKTPKEIYAMFKIEQELTPEEEAEVRKENPWIEDR